MPPKDAKTARAPQAETRPENEDGDLSEDAQQQFDEMHENESPGRPPVKPKGPRTDRAALDELEQATDSDLGGDDHHDRITGARSTAVDDDRRGSQHKMDREQPHTDTPSEPDSDIRGKGREAKEQQRQPHA